jgi:hypothetical protein
MRLMMTWRAINVGLYSAEMENFYSRLALDIIGKAVFNYDFNSLKTDDPVIKAVYTVLREAEYRSVTFIPYWKVPPLRWLVPRQKACQEALVVVNDTLNMLITRTKKLVEVGSGSYCSPRHPTHFEPSSPELCGTL